MKHQILRKIPVVIPLFIVILVFMSTCRLNNNKRACKLRFGVLFTEELEKGPLDGRMLLMISNDESREPRFQISSRNPNAQLIFGIDVDGLLPGDLAIFDANIFGFPLKSISEIPAGEYSVQALLHKYETFHRADGMEEFLKSTKAPYYDGTVEYGDRHPHCWCGDYENPLSISMLTINQRFAPIMVKHILKAAPPGADTTSWRY